MQYRLSDLRQAISLPSMKYLGPSRSEIVQALVDQRGHVPWGCNHAPNNVGRQSAVPHTRSAHSARRDILIVGRMVGLVTSTFRCNSLDFFRGIDAVGADGLTFDRAGSKLFPSIIHLT